MLKTNKKIILTGESVIEGVSVEGYQAQISSSNPKDITLSSWQNNKELYKANRTICRADEAEFEDYAYRIQDELLAKSSETETTTEA